MRIASLAPSVTEILYELGAEKEIVCSTIFCDWPPQAKSLPKIGSWINVDERALVELQPDVVFTSSAVQGPLTNRLKERGLPVININPVRLSEFVESYNQIGEITGRQKQAAAIANDLYKKIMSNFLRQHPYQNVKVYCEEWSDPPMASGNWVPDLVELAGGMTGIVPAGSLSRAFPLGELQAYQPDVMVMHICGFGMNVDLASVEKRSGWGQLPAVRDKHIYIVEDSLLNRPTSRLLRGLEKLREALVAYHERDGGVAKQ